VGGLDSAHARASLAALSHADALLFVIDPSAPVSEPEIAFLHRAAARIETVAFILTKTDIFPEWREVLADTRRLVDEVAPGFAECPCIGVSSKLLVDSSTGRTYDGEDIAEKLFELSGFRALDSYLVEEVVGREKLLRVKNANRLIHAVATDLLDWARSMTDSIASREAFEEQIAEQDKILASAAAIQQSSRVRLLDVFTKVHQLTWRDIQGETDSCHDRYEQRIAYEWSPDLLGPLSNELISDLYTCTGSIESRLIDRTEEALGEYASSVGLAELDMELSTLALPEQEALSARPRPKRQLAEHFRLARTGMYFLGGSTVVVGVASVVAAPVLLVGGVLAASATVAEHRSAVKAFSQQEARRILKETTARWQRDMGLCLADVIREGRQTAESAIQVGLELRVEAAGAQRAQLADQHRTQSSEGSVHQWRDIAGRLETVLSSANGQLDVSRGASGCAREGS